MVLGLAIGAVLIISLYAIYALGVKVGKMESDAEWARKTADYFEGKLDESLGLLSEQIKRAQFEKTEKELFGEYTPEPYQPYVTGPSQPYQFPDISWGIDGKSTVKYDGNNTWTVRNGDSFTLTYPEASALDVSHWNGEAWGVVKE